LSTFGRIVHDTLRRTVPPRMKRTLARRFPGLRDRLPLVPFMQPEEIRCIERHLRRPFTMLEFGCGGSTLHFSRRVAAYHAVEHDREWFEKIRPRVASTVQLHLVVPDRTPTACPVPAGSWDELAHSQRAAEFAAYLRAPEEKIGVPLDAVLIDGRARPECARAVLPWLHAGSLVFIHDFFRRPHYHVVLERYEVIDGIDGEGQTLAVLRPAGYNPPA
jgi:protein O-GlcNAc transferase